MGRFRVHDVGYVSRMLRRRVPILRLGSRGPGGDQRSLHLCPQVFASVCKAIASVRECRAFWGSREERRDERREKRGEKREERGEARGERREERGERGGDRGERGERRVETGEKREERGEGRGEERGEEKRKRREERRQDDPGPKFPDWWRAWGVIIFAIYVSRVRIRVRGASHVEFQCIGLLGANHTEGDWRHSIFRSPIPKANQNAAAHNVAAY